MAGTIGEDSTSNKRSAVLDRAINEAQESRRVKRLAQHQHWMRLMMEGQATPDLSYQKPKL